MDSRVVTAMRDYFQADAVLTSWFTGLYDRDASYLVGVKRGKRTEDYPYVALVPVRERSVDRWNSIQTVSCVCGVHQNAIDGDVMRGVIEVMDTSKEIIASMERDCMFGTSYLTGMMDTVKTMTDLGLRHPIYEIEITLDVLIRKEAS